MALSGAITPSAKRAAPLIALSSRSASISANAGICRNSSGPRSSSWITKAMSRSGAM